MIKEYCEQLYSNKSKNLHEMDKFLDTNVPKLTQEETDLISTSTKDISLVAKNLLTKNSPGSGGLNS